MKFYVFMAPFAFCSFGIIISAFNPIAGLIVSSMGLPLYLVIRHYDNKASELDLTSRSPITSGDKGN